MTQKSQRRAEIAAAVVGCTLVASAIAANQQWLDRHFLPAFFISRRLYVLIESLARILIAALGIGLALFVRPWLGRLVTVPPGALLAAAARITLAVVLAVGTSEAVLRRLFRSSSEEQPASQEPLRRHDAHLGWVFIPARTGRVTTGGRTVEYTFDAMGYRVPRASEPVDFERPAILFSGESVMVGEGLQWEETVPAQVGALLGIQSANLAVSGFASDQAYLRLSAELPRFRKPVAVVSLFTPAIFDRNLDEDRPHLGPGLIWLPAKSRWRLAILASWVIPYRSDEAVERGIMTTREVLLATANLARERDAVPLLCVPEFMPGSPEEQLLRRRILEDTGLPYVLVPLDPSWRQPDNSHPDARGAHAIAVTVANRLRAAIGEASGN